MLECRSNFSDKTAFAIESSKVHWSELDYPSDSDGHHSPESSRLYFDEVLKKHPEWGGSRFFQDFDDLSLGEKIAEGAQGEIYRANKTKYGTPCVVKVFKEGYPLQDILRQIPPSMLSAVNYDSVGSPLEYVKGGTMMIRESLENRFAIVMEEQSCDLRTLIDEQMLCKNNQGPPFTTGLVTKFMHKISSDMASLHYRYGIVHKNLKASNVLVTVYILYEDVTFGSETVVVADFECSMVGVVGTRFWRAPEILRQLKDGKRPVEITMKCDVYSFAMLSYELITGRIPFEDYAPSDYDVVVSGGRPKLPINLDSSIKDIITECWHPEPSERPDFISLKKRLGVLLLQREREGWVNAKYRDRETYCKLNNIELPLDYVSFNEIAAEGYSHFLA